MVESTHCAVSMDLAGQEFRRHVGMRGLSLLYNDKNLLTGKTQTQRTIWNFLQSQKEVSFVLSNVLATWTTEAHELWPGWLRTGF